VAIAYAYCGQIHAVIASLLPVHAPD
jgi:hypothetical protein